MSSNFSPFLRKLLISIKIILPLFISFSPPFSLSSSLMAQSSPARWIVANKIGKNEEKLPRDVPTIYEQKWGQFLITAANPIDDWQNSSTSIPSNSTSLQILDWKEWENMSNESTGLGRNGRSKALGNPILIVAKKDDNNIDERRILPPEAEEEEEENENVNNKKVEWKEGWAHLERKLTAGTMPLNLSRFPVENDNNGNVTMWEKGGIGGEQISTENPPKMGTVDFIKFSNKFTTSTTPIPESSLNLIEGLNGTNTGLGAANFTPFGQNIPIQPQNAVDLRQLPTLMHLLKQIPTVIRTFQENPSVSAGSFTEKIGVQNNGHEGKDIFALPTGNGLIQQFLGVSSKSNADQVNKIQSRAVSNEYGGLGQIDIEGKQHQMAEDEIEINKGIVDGNVQMPFPNSQIVPSMTTNAGIPSVGRIEIRRLPLSSSIKKSPEIVNETTLFKGLRIDKEQKKKISVKERELRLNIYGVTLAPPSAYEAPLPAVQNLPSTISWEKTNKKPRPQFDIEKLTVNELTQLEKIHKKLFNAENGETMAKEEKGVNEWKSSAVGERNQENDRPTIGIPNIINQIKSQNITKKISSSKQSPSHLTAKNQNLKELVRKGVEIGQLDQSMLNDLLAIGELPDLEEMTRGMDLSLLHKPGGFAILKQQFVERLIQRAFNGNGGRKS